MVAKAQGWFVLLVCVAAMIGCGGGSAGPSWPAQTLIEVSPGAGTTVGGTVVTLRGSGFLHPQHQITQVRFGERVADTWEILDDGMIVVESPAGSPGSTVINIVGENSPTGDGILLTRGFTYRTPVLYVAEGVTTLDPQLYALDPESDALRVVGPIGFPVESMAMSPTGELYAVEPASPFRLLHIDPRTGAGTPVAPVRDAFFGSEVYVEDISFVDGRLLGRTEYNDLVEIDLATGYATAIGLIPVATPGGGIATLRDDSLYLAQFGPSGQLYVLNVLTGAISPGPILDRFVLFEDLIFDGTDLYALEADLPGPDGVGLLRIEAATGIVHVVMPLPEAAIALARDF